MKIFFHLVELSSSRLFRKIKMGYRRLSGNDHNIPISIIVDNLSHHPQGISSEI